MLSLFNSSKIFFALTMIISNVGSRYVMNDFNKFSNFVMQNDLLKSIIIFAMFFVATKDIVLSLVLMLVFLVIIKVLLNENSKYNIIPAYIKEQMTNQEGASRLAEPGSLPLTCLARAQSATPRPNDTRPNDTRPNDKIGDKTQKSVPINQPNQAIQSETIPYKIDSGFVSEPLALSSNLESFGFRLNM